MRDTEITIFDTETTGLDPLSDRIIELAAIRVCGNEKRGEFHSLVQPGIPVPAAASQVNGISDAMLAGAPQMAGIIPAFSEFIRGSCLCSYNAPFDIGFVAGEYKRAGVEFPQDMPVIDVLAMARQLLTLERYPLWYVAQSLGIGGGQEHRALSDVELTFRVFSALNAMLESRSISELEDYVCLFGRGCRPHEELMQRKIRRIQEAIGRGSKVRIRYFSRSDARVSDREVIPRSVRLEKGRAYLTGFCCMKSSERTFNVEGILRLETAGQETDLPVLPGPPEGMA